MSGHRPMRDADAIKGDRVPRPRIKICGLTRLADARLAAKLGVTHVGCVLAPSSPRRVRAEQARRIFEAAGSEVRHVLVFKRERPEQVLAAAEEAGTSHVQLFEFSEDEALLLEKLGLTVYRVHPVPPDAQELPLLVPDPSESRPAMLDVGGGGSGRSFHWEILGAEAPDATFIAGGIGPENVASLLARRPYGVDLSSRVESEPGIKDPVRLALFFEQLEKAL